MRIITSGLLLFLSVAVVKAVFANAGEETTKAFWLWQFLGRLHPLAVHFPVGLLVFAAFLELLTLKNFDGKLRPGIHMLITAGAISAGLSVVFGLLLAQDGDYGEELLSLHQWIGITSFVLGLGTWYLHGKAAKDIQLKNIRPYRLLLVLSAAGIAIAGHYGASLTHGKDYLSSTFPWNGQSERELAGTGSGFVLPASNTEMLSPQQELELNVQVRAILAHNCYQCHGEEKIKGDLRLDSKEFVFKGGKGGPVIVPGDADKSELYRRITLPSDHKEAMPSKGKKLSEKDIALVEFWIRKGAPWPDGAEAQQIFKEALLAPRNPALPPTENGLTHPVDRFVNPYFKANNISWPNTADDNTFVRRLYLDIIGLLPTPAETAAFIQDTRQDKRALLARELLNRNDQYASHWLTFWNDALRNDYTGTGYITGGRFNITQWLYSSLKTNKPYDIFTQELVSPTDESKGFVEGIKWRGAVNASQTVEMQAAQNVAQVFLGVNLKCASCHNSFTSNWKLTDAYGFANIFADSSLEINRCDKPTGKFTSARMLWKELGTIDSAATRTERMTQLAQQITKPENGRYYRTLVNRIWAQLMGRGLVEPVDIMDNDPWNQDLLDWLAYDFQSKGKDIKELIYLIVTSKTYQLPSVGLKSPDEIISKQYVFRGTLKKRMTAEQFSDAVSSVVEPVYGDSVMKFNPFKKDKAQPNSNLPNSNMFVRASFVANDQFLKALGRPNRENVSTGRESQANLLQALELTNGEKFNMTLKRGAEKWKQQYKTSEEIIKHLYSRALGRAPNANEIKIARGKLGPNPSVEGIQDLFWATLLLPEFQIIN